MCFIVVDQALVECIICNCSSWRTSSIFFPYKEESFQPTDATSAEYPIRFVNLRTLEKQALKDIESDFWEPKESKFKVALII